MDDSTYYNVVDKYKKGIGELIAGYNLEEEGNYLALCHAMGYLYASLLCAGMTPDACDEMINRTSALITRFQMEKESDDLTA